MAQNYTPNSYQADHIGETDLKAMENNFACLRSMFSGAAGPPNAFAGMTWFDTTNKLLRIRNNDNNEWIGVMHGSSAAKLWIYSNSAVDGWAIDGAPPTDAIIVLKGGAQAYNANGGTVAGTWTQPSFSILEAQLAAHTHDSDGAHSHQIEAYTSGTGAYNEYLGSVYTMTSGYVIANGAHTHGSIGSGTAHSHGTSFRPAAALGTLQYPDA